MGGAVPRINRFLRFETYERFDVGLRWRNNELLRQRMTGAQQCSYTAAPQNNSYSSPSPPTPRRHKSCAYKVE